MAVWSSPEWRAQAVSWLDERLASAGIERRGDVEQPHLEPWATVLKVPTNAGGQEVDQNWTRAPLETLATLLDDSYLGGA
jgi:hypothetical protein